MFLRIQKNHLVASAGMFQKVTLDILRIIFSEARGPVQCVSGHDYGLHKDLLSG